MGDVVGLAPIGTAITSGEHAAAISFAQRPSHRLVGESLGGSEVDDGTFTGGVLGGNHGTPMSQEFCGFIDACDARIANDAMAS